jgi:hypothetical protein
LGQRQDGKQQQEQQTAAEHQRSQSHEIAFSDRGRRRAGA